VELPVGTIVFGSGWAPLAERVEVVGRWPYTCVPGLPPTSVRGHPGEVVWGTWRGVPCLIFVGRWHVYEGRTPAEVALPGTVAAALGCQWMLSTNAAGGIAPRLRVGQLVAITDDLGIWSGYGVLPGPALRHPRERPPGPVYSPELRAALSEASREANVHVEEGILAMMPGPNYETAAEIGMLRTAGASLVSMSTVPEARCARLFGVEVAALSCVTNLAPARPGTPLAHEDVLATLEATWSDAERLIETWLEHPRVRRGSR